MTSSSFDKTPIIELKNPDVQDLIAIWIYNFFLSTTLICKNSARKGKYCRVVTNVVVVGPEAQDPYRVNSWLSIVSERVFRHDILNEHLVVLVLVLRIASLKFPRGLRTSHRTLCEALWMFPFNVVENLKSLCNVIQCMCTVLVLVFFPNTFLHQLNSQNKPSGSVNCIKHCFRIVSHSYVPKSTFIQYTGNS